MPRRERWTLRPSTDPWLPIAQRLQEFVQAQGLQARDVVVLLPFAQHLPLARGAWARLAHAGWMPRFETTQTLRATFPSEPGSAEGPTGDPAVDRLAAAQLLTRVSWGEAERRRNPAMFEFWAQGVVEMAHEFLRAAHACAPSRRQAWWGHARTSIVAHAGAGSAEAALARLALEWAAMQDTGWADALFTHRPAAWAAVHAGGADPLVQALMDAADVPVLEIDTDPRVEALFDAASPDAQVLACQDFEDEAQAAAAQVLSHLAHGHVPVALVAQDRVLVRRVRALLERQQIALRDETGWRLSTTRVGACVAGLLRLAHPRASTDELLDWLKSAFVTSPTLASQGSVTALERVLRRQQWAQLAEVDARALPLAARALWSELTNVLRQLRAAPRRVSLADWNERLAAALRSCGAWQALESDDAGVQLLQALHLLGQPGDETAFARHASAAHMDLAGYTAWVDSLLEAGVFAPTTQTEAEVVITPLQRVMLRPFGAVVMPGCDEQRLGTASMHPWLSDRERAALGLATRAEVLAQQSLAFAHLLWQPRVSLLWRRSHEGEPLNPSVLVERLQLLRSRQAALGVPPEDARVLAEVAPQPQEPGRPRAPSLLPVRLSATSYEALRDCPYRFFALRMLGLEEAAELDDEIERRDYGTWLHAVLQRFHEARREQPLGAVDEVERLVAFGKEEQQARQLDEAAFLPFALRFRQVARMYVQWMLEHEQRGAQVLKSEVTLEAPLPRRPGVSLYGKVDRVDAVKGDEGEQTLVIDYKTGNIQGLKNKQRNPLEDTQLAFYAALLKLAAEAPGRGHALRAIYLALDGRQIEEAEHPDVEHTAGQLLDGMADDLTRIAEGAPLPPLGEGSVCEHCEARGLCRKGHWASNPFGEEHA